MAVLAVLVPTIRSGPSVTDPAGLAVPDTADGFLVLHHWGSGYFQGIAADGHFGAGRRLLGAKSLPRLPGGRPPAVLRRRTSRLVLGRLVADTGTGEALPLLAFTLQQLAADVPRGGHLSTNLYERLGGVRGALTSQAGQAMLAATATTGRTAEQVLAGLLRLVSVDEHGTPIRTRVPVDALPEVTRAELTEFTARRLLTTDTENHMSVIGVAHEAFLTGADTLAAQSS